MKNRVLFLSLSASVAVTACSGGSTNSITPVSGANQAAVRAATSTPIQHVIVIVQQGRSFDNLFHKYPGANFATVGLGPGGKKIRLRALPLKSEYALENTHYQFEQEFKNDGWENQIRGHNDSPKCQGPGWVNDPSCYKFTVTRTPYSYVERSNVQQYWTMAQQYTLGDEMFASNSGPLFPSLQYMIAGQSAHASEDPDETLWGCPNPRESVYYLGAKGEQLGPDPCLPLQNSGAYPTLGNELDTAGVSWHYYVESERYDGARFNAYAAVNSVYDGPDWTNGDISSPNTNVLTDISSGKLANVSWVMPSAAASDRAGPQSGNRGPSWVTSIVNALGESQYWKNAAIIVIWSDWGGWYDHVPPKQYVPEGLGYRVPLIVISPYAKAGYVSHVQYETASTTRFIESTFGLPSLGYADKRATSLGTDCFDFTQHPRKFKPIGN